MSCPNVNPWLKPSIFMHWASMLLQTQMSMLSTPILLNLWCFLINTYMPWNCAMFKLPTHKKHPIPMSSQERNLSQSNLLSPSLGLKQSCPIFDHLDFLLTPSSIVIYSSLQVAPNTLKHTHVPILWSFHYIHPCHEFTDVLTLKFTHTIFCFYLSTSEYFDQPTI